MSCNVGVPNASRIMFNVLCSQGQWATAAALQSVILSPTAHWCSCCTIERDPSANSSLVQLLHYRAWSFRQQLTGGSRSGMHITCCLQLLHTQWHAHYLLRATATHTAACTLPAAYDCYTQSGMHITCCVRLLHTQRHAYYLLHAIAVMRQS